MLALQGKPKSGNGVADWFSPDSDLDQDLAPAVDDGSRIFWHISYMLLKPYVPVFQKMVLLGGADRPFTDDQEVAIEALRDININTKSVKLNLERACSEKVLNWSHAIILMNLVPTDALVRRNLFGFIGFVASGPPTISWAGDLGVPRGFRRLRHLGCGFGLECEAVRSLNSQDARACTGVHRGQAACQAVAAPCS